MQQAAVEANAEQVGLTRALAADAAALRFEDIPADAVTVAKQCLLDWIGVTVAGAAEPLSRILQAETAEAGGAAQASLAGALGKASMVEAARVNGAAGHALDFDDVHEALNGHPTVPVAPAVLALAEHQGKSGADLITAFVAGGEAECRLGLAIGPSHYGRGWHNTATLGTFGAAAAAARLLDLDARATATALGIAATQAAGLKAMFGTMCKPLHAGNAAAAGLMAARLAARGFTSNPAGIETAQGFAATQSETFDAAAAFAPVAGGFHTRNVLFKYHAACYLTHASLEACRLLRDDHGVTPEAVAGVSLKVAPGHLKVCDIPEPTTGLEAKFSLRLTTAFGLAGLDTARLDTFTDANTARPDLNALRDKVSVDPGEREVRMASDVVVELNDGRSITESFDVSRPAADLDDQWSRLETKFRSLVEPLLGAERTERLAAACRGLEAADGTAGLTADWAA